MASEKKQITPFLKITHKVFLKYQRNGRFSSLCLVPGNAIFGCRGRKKKSVTPYLRMGDAPIRKVNYIVVVATRQ